MSKAERRHNTTQADINFIRDHVDTMTDGDMAKILRGSVSWVRLTRRNHNIRKNKKSVRPHDKKLSKIEKRLKYGDKTAVNDILDGPSSEEGLRILFEQMFQNSQHHAMLKKMYTPEELKYYLEEFSTLFSEVKRQGGSLTSSEFRNLDSFIQSNIRKMRLVIDEKETKDTIRRILEPFDGDESVASEEARAIIFTLRQQIKDVNRHYKDLNEQSIKTQEALDMVRKERLKRMTDQENGILKTIQYMQDKEKRKKISEHASYLEMAKSKVEREWKDAGIIYTGEPSE